MKEHLSLQNFESIQNPDKEEKHLRLHLLLHGDFDHFLTHLVIYRPGSIIPYKGHPASFGLYDAHHKVIWINTKLNSLQTSLGKLVHAI